MQVKCSQFKMWALPEQCGSYEKGALAHSRLLLVSFPIFHSMTGQGKIIFPALGACGSFIVSHILTFPPSFSWLHSDLRFWQVLCGFRPESFVWGFHYEESYRSNIHFFVCLSFLLLHLLQLCAYNSLNDSIRTLKTSTVRGLTW